MKYYDFSKGGNKVTMAKRNAKRKETGDNKNPLSFHKKFRLYHLRERRMLFATICTFLLIVNSMPFTYYQLATATAGNPEQSVSNGQSTNIDRGKAIRDACIEGENLSPKDISTFNVHAIQIPIVYNSYGVYDPDGVMYILEENIANVTQEVRENRNKTVPLIEPLAIRTNVGKCVEIHFTNDLNGQTASIHPTGVSYDPNTSDGMAVGYNNDTTVAPGQSTVYRWYPEKEGSYFFSDGSREINRLRNITDNISVEEPVVDMSLRQHGLFGALIVESAGASWTHPVTGEPLSSGVKAAVHYPDRKDTREFVIFYHDDADLINANGSKTRNLIGEEASLYTINYRGDDLASRLDPNNCPDGVSVEVCKQPEYFYSSWVHGDPGGSDLIFPTYVHDPVRFITIGAQTEENHVHHLHEHRWKADPTFENSTTLDSQTVNPGITFNNSMNVGFGNITGDATVRPDMTYTQALTAGGAGYIHGAAGDVLFHCHLFPHYGSGMWGLMRTFDRLEPNLQPLGDNERTPPPPADENDGFPHFIEPNKTDGSPLPPPNPNGGGRPYTGPEERAALNYYNNTSETKPGAPMVDPCQVNNYTGSEFTNIFQRNYSVVAIDKDIQYNRYGDHDPHGRIFVLEKDKELVLNGTKEPEPLILRANVGDCINVKFTNNLTRGGHDAGAEGLSMHIHFVAFDVLGSDGTAVGYNYDQGTQPGESINYRWYADEEGNIFMHDHMTGIEKGMHGTGGVLVVEPFNSTWLNPITNQTLYQEGSENTSYAHAVILPDEFIPGKKESFREFVIVYQDFVELVNRSGFPVNMQGKAPNGDIVNDNAHPEMSTHDHGVMAINYKNAPLYHRMANATLEYGGNGNTTDRAYIFSSWIHDDPETPLLKAYTNEPIKMKVIQVGHEEQHNLVIHGQSWPLEPFVTTGLSTEAQAIGVSEQFNADIRAFGLSNGSAILQLPTTRVSDRNDALYASYAMDDIWNGMWGIIRSWNDTNAAAEDGENFAPLPNGTFSKRVPPNIIENGAGFDLQKPVVTGKTPSPLPDNYQGYRDGRGASSCPPIGSDTDPDNRLNRIDPFDPQHELKHFEIVAFTQPIIYNKNGDQDPHGAVFALKEDVDAIKNGIKPLEPLVIRASYRDCVEVTLHNELPDTSIPQEHNSQHPLMPVECAEHVNVACFEPEHWPNSDRISLHPQRLTYDIGSSDGTNVGFNPYDQTIGPGENITYTWYLNKTGTAVLTDMADVRGHRHHGSFALLVVEPQGANYYKPNTFEPLRSGTVADIVFDEESNRTNFREFALLLSDGMFINNTKTGLCIVDREVGDPKDVPCNQSPVNDPEDQGFFGVNYRSEPFIWRLLNVNSTNVDNYTNVSNAEQSQGEPLDGNKTGTRVIPQEEIALVFSSNRHGDPNTPLLNASLGDPVVLRLADVADKPRGFSFHMAGHNFNMTGTLSQDPVNRTITMDGVTHALTVSKAFDLELIGGAGGLQNKTGDYIYQDMKLKKYLEGGTWGILRVNSTYPSLESIHGQNDVTGIKQSPLSNTGQ